MKTEKPGRYLLMNHPLRACGAALTQVYGVYGERVSISLLMDDCNLHCRTWAVEVLEGVKRVKCVGRF